MYHLLVAETYHSFHSPEAPLSLTLQIRFANGGHAFAASSGAMIFIMDSSSDPDADTGAAPIRNGLLDGSMTLRGHGAAVTVSVI